MGTFVQVQLSKFQPPRYGERRRSVVEEMVAALEEQDLEIILEDVQEGAMFNVRERSRITSPQCLTFLTPAPPLSLFRDLTGCNLHCV